MIKKNNDVIIKDDNGNDYKINDLKKFRNHIIKYHSTNGRGDNSLHIEKGRNFTVTQEFFNKLLLL